MNPDEVTFLSAYLDGTLDPEPRSRVEAALLSDSQLADRLRELTAVRDLVAGLSRPVSGRDLSAAVVARLPRTASAPAPAGSPRLLARPAGRAAALLATAAALLAVASATVISAAWRGAPGPASPLARGLPAPEVPVASITASSPIAGPAAEPEARVAVSDAEPRPAASLPLAPDVRDRQRDGDVQRVRRLLDSPSLRRVYVVTDVVGGQATARVGDLLGRTPRKSPTYVCLTIGPGEMVDPERPGAASVFAVVVDPTEQTRLRDTLDEMFAGNIAEVEPRPETLTMLADVGHLTVLPGKGVGDVFVPDDVRTSLRDDRPPAIPLGTTVVPDPIVGLFPPPTSPRAGLAEPPVRATEAKAREADREDLDRPDAPNRRRRNRPEPAAPSVVLVWVRHAPAAGPDRATR